MYSICIKFKAFLNWRPMCRQFETLPEMIAFINDAFDKWPVLHCSVFLNGRFLNCYWLSPAQRDARAKIALSYWRGRHMSGNSLTLQKN